jgi:signal transduction histidine kinase
MELSSKLQQTNKEIRSLAHGLVPVRVESGSFMSALEHLARRTCERDRLTCEFACIEPVRIEDDFTADQLYHIAREATINAVKHAGADHILISLGWEEQTISLKVTDNGRGFDKNSIESSGLGLQIMAYRAATIGAELGILSEEGGGGTQVTCRLVSVKDRSR